MSFTVGGFAQARPLALRGKGGNVSRRRDDGVSPSPRHGLAERDAAHGRDEYRNAASVVAAPHAEPAAKPTARPGRGSRQRRVTSLRKRAAAALEWQDLRLPVVGRLWANAWLLFSLVAALLVALMYLLQASGVATTGYDIQRLQAERSDWQLRNEQLQLELAKRRSLTWIEAEATGRLGMVRPEPTAIAFVGGRH